MTEQTKPEADLTGTIVRLVDAHLDETPNMGRVLEVQEDGSLWVQWQWSGFPLSVRQIDVTIDEVATDFYREHPAQLPSVMHPGRDYWADETYA